MPVVRAAPSGSPALHHVDVDQSRYPWSAIGKVTNSTGTECSGVMVASDKVLTAAHCLYNYRGLRFVTPDSVHFLLGYRGGQYSAHGHVASYEIGPGFDPQRYQDEDMIIIGTPEECLEKILRYEEAGVDQLLCYVQFGMLPHEKVMRNLELLGTQVIPKLEARGHRVDATAVAAS